MSTMITIIVVIVAGQSTQYTDGSVRVAKTSQFE